MLKKINNLGAIHILLILGACLMIPLAVAYVGIKSKNTESSTKNQKTAQSIVNFEDCARATNYVVSEDLSSSIPGAHDINRIFTCFAPKNGGKFVAKFERCEIGKCFELDQALLHYCSNDYARLKGLAVNTQSLAFSEAALVKDDIARASLRCHDGSDPEWYKKNPTIVFMQKSGREWQAILTIINNQCEEIDNKGIPLAIAGTCFDASSKSFRIPK